MKHEKHSPANSVSPFRMEAPSTPPERRKNLRKPLHFPVYFQKVGAQDGRLLSGNTVNVSPGGALVRIQGATLRDGELVSVEMAPPASEGLLEQHSRFHGYARVVRVDAPAVDANNGKQVALEFCESARLDF